MTIVNRIEKYGPCSEAQTWLGRRSNITKAWKDCPDAHWMIWLLGELHISRKINRKTLVLAACAVARTILRQIPSLEKRPRIAIETAEAWCRGEATIDQVRTAADAARETRTACAYAAAAAAHTVCTAATAAADAAYDTVCVAAANVDTTHVADAVRSVVPANIIVHALRGKS